MAKQRDTVASLRKEIDAVRDELDRLAAHGGPDHAQWERVIVLEQQVGSLSESKLEREADSRIDDRVDARLKKLGIPTGAVTLVAILFLGPGVLRDAVKQHVAQSLDAHMGIVDSLASSAAHQAAETRSELGKLDVEVKSLEATVNSSTESLSDTAKRYGLLERELKKQEQTFARLHDVDKDAFLSRVDQLVRLFEAKNVDDAQRLAHALAVTDRIALSENEIRINFDRVTFGERGLIEMTVANSFLDMWGYPEGRLRLRSENGEWRTIAATYTETSPDPPKPGLK